jgi:hypothetical protein
MLLLNFLVSPCCNFKVRGARLLSLLLKTMEDVNRLAKLGDIHDTKGAAFLSDSYLANPCANAIHGLPVIRIQPMLHPVKLIPALRRATSGNRRSALSESPRNSMGLEGCTQTSYTKFCMELQ